jgi:thiol peroxidase
MSSVTLKGNAVRLSGMLPKVGSQAPDFKLTASDLKDHTLSEFKGKRVLISIVPSLDTPTCSLSAKKFNEAAKKHPEVAILTVSCDLPFAQKRFCSQENIANLLTLSLMRSKDFAKSYGVLIEEGPLAGICSRAVLVLDTHGKVLYTELVSEITHEPSYDKALEVLLKK